MRLNGTVMRILCRRGLASALRAAAVDSVAGEPAYTTDTKRFYISDGTRYVSGAEMVVPQFAVYEGDVVTNSGEVVVI